MNLTRYFFILSILFFINACVTTNKSTLPEQADVEDRIILSDDVSPLPDDPIIKPEDQHTDPAMSVVVSKLLVQAETQRDAGLWDAANDSIERALRVEPRNAILWNRLAEVRYAQQDMQQAVQLAAKSNTLAGQNHSLRRQNWYLMSNAYRALGDTESAEIYRQKLIN